MPSCKFFSLILLLPLLAGSLLVGFTGASQPAVLAAGPLSLVAVPVQSKATLQRFHSTALPAYALLDGYILAGADSLGQASLLRAGLAFKVLDAELGSGYYLVTRIPSAINFDLTAYGRVLLELDSQALLQTSPDQAERLSLAGAELRYINLTPIVLPLEQVTERAFPEDVTPDPFVQMIIDQVSQDTLSQYDRQLAGKLPVWVNDDWYTITTRYTFSGKPIRKAAHYVGQRMADQGLDVEYQVWYDDTNPNVIGQFTGLTNPDDIFIIGAHLDDVQDTPGADDNASGSVATMLAAELLSQYQWNCTLRFAFWTGEEQGYFGSHAYAQRSYNRGENIVGYLNLDMLAWNTLGTSPGIDLVYHPYMPLTQQLARLMSDVVSAYDLDLVPQLVTSYGGFSDHSSFWDFGYTSIHAIEDESDFNPFYHTSGDTPAHLDLDYFAEFTKASLATFLHMSACLSVGYLDGTVTDATRGTAIPNAAIQIENEASDVLTVQADDDGYYTQTLPAGTYTITVSANGYLTETFPAIAILGDQVTTQNISLQPVPTHGQLAGQVTDALSGYPLPGVFVIAFPYGRQAITDLSGFYSMTLSAGDYWVTARLSGYLPQTFTATVDVSQTTLLDFSLELAPPEIDIIPSAISVTMLIDQPIVKTAFVRNLGDGPLNFTITNPQPAAWLSFTPEAGNLEPAASQGISLTLDTTGLVTGLYTSTLEFASNDPDTPLIAMPLTMTVVSECVPVRGVDFIWIPVSPFAGEEVTFLPSLNGSEPISFYWGFGDGLTSTAEIPSRTFTTGIYTIALLTSNDCGIHDVTYIITINAPPWQGYLPLVNKK